MADLLPDDPASLHHDAAPLHEHELTSWASPLSTMLPLLQQPRDASKGGVPLPSDWHGTRAVFGDITRNELQRDDLIPPVQNTAILRYGG